jgi:hypothetical protein
MNERQCLVLAVTVPVFIIVIALDVTENVAGYRDNWGET